ncbi:MAG: TIGR04255 family protein [bacterium]
MNSSESTLPDYKKPPVVEVAFSLQFEPLRKLRTPHIGLLWNEYREQGLVTVQEQPPLNQYFELFGEEVLHPRIEISKIPTIPRCWFVNEDNSELVQVQEDRFVHNWRRLTFKQPYIRYSTIKEKFIKDLEKFQKFLHENYLGDLYPNQCELTYVNQIPKNEIFKNANQLRNVLGICDVKYSDPFLKDIEKIDLNAQYVMSDIEDKPIGRLHMTAKSSKLIDQKEGMQLMLVARGRPKDTTREKLLEFFDVGHEWIVRGFTSITTKEMHEIWGRFK